MHGGIRRKQSSVSSCPSTCNDGVKEKQSSFNCDDVNAHTQSRSRPSACGRARACIRACGRVRVCLRAYAWLRALSGCLQPDGWREKADLLAEGLVLGMSEDRLGVGLGGRAC
eukprot:178914-Pleurochrysis_carterae.AAC.2